MASAAAKLARAGAAGAAAAAQRGGRTAPRAGRPGEIALLPVGALTSKPYAFTARPWEIRRTESIDVSDGVGSNIRVDYKETEVMRVLPRENSDINAEWIHDKARFSYDGLKRQRLDQPYKAVGGGDASLTPISWPEALEAAAELVSKPTTFVLGRSVDLETAVAVKDLAARMGNARLYREGGGGVEDDHPNYLKLTDVDEADVVLLVGINPRLEATMLNLRLRKRSLEGGLTVGIVGPPADLTYDAQCFGLHPEHLVRIAEGRHPFCQALAQAERPLVLYGSGVLERDDGESVVRLLKSINPHLQGGEAENVVHLASSHANDAGLTALYVEPLPTGDGGIAASDSETFYLVDLCDTALAAQLKAQGKVVVYQGTHGDENLVGCDMLLPGAAFVEKEGTYINMEGRPQRTAKVYNPPGVGREDWKIVRALSQSLGGACTLPYDDAQQMAQRVATLVPAPVDQYTKSGVGTIAGTPSEARVWNTPLPPLVGDFYRTDAVSKASVVMAKTSAARRKLETNFPL